MAYNKNLISSVSLSEFVYDSMYLELRWCTGVYFDPSKEKDASWPPQ